MPPGCAVHVNDTRCNLGVHKCVLHCVRPLCVLEHGGYKNATLDSIPEMYTCIFLYGISSPSILVTLVKFSEWHIWLHCHVIHGYDITALAKSFNFVQLLTLHTTCHCKIIRKVKHFNDQFPLLQHSCGQMTCFYTKNRSSLYFTVPRGKGLCSVNKV